MYRITVNGAETYWMVMRNVFSCTLKMHKKYDLKGSTVDRAASNKEKVLTCIYVLIIVLTYCMYVCMYKDRCTNGYLHCTHNAYSDMHACAHTHSDMHAHAHTHMLAWSQLIYMWQSRIFIDCCIRRNQAQHLKTMILSISMRRYMLVKNRNRRYSKLLK